LQNSYFNHELKEGVYNELQWMMGCHSVISGSAGICWNLLSYWRKTQQNIF